MLACNKYYGLILLVLQGYKVFHTLNPGTTPMSLWTQTQVDNSHLVTIGNLFTNRTYTFTVLAFTEKGDGPLAEPVQVKTQQGGKNYLW